MDDSTGLVEHLADGVLESDFLSDRSSYGELRAVGRPIGGLNVLEEVTPRTALQPGPDEGPRLSGERNETWIAHEGELAL